MYLRLLILFLITGFSFTYSQVIVTVPEFPTENDSIKIIFNAQEGANTPGLRGYTGTVYTHTGVITSTSSGQWAHVIGTWGNNTTQPALTRIGTDLYELVIGRPRQFYSVTNPSEKILKLAFVFRSANASQQTEDIFQDIYAPGITVIVSQPNVITSFGHPLRSPVFAGQNDTVGITINSAAIGTSVQSLTLFVNGSQVAQTSNPTLNYSFIAANHSSGVNYVDAIAVDTSSNSDTASFAIMSNPPVVNQSFPAGLDLGINYIDNNSVTLALFAPYKEFVYVLGDFNDWKVDTAYFMKRHQVNADSVIWWLNISGLTPSQEYILQYLVDGVIRIADPYSEKVSDPWNDQHISPTTYPGLIQYPAGKTEQPATVIQTAQQPYQWQVASFQRPAKKDMIIYELLIRDFLSTHDYQTLEDTLNYLKTLGVNVIELMPIMEFEGNESWGYNPSFHVAVDKYYGPKNSLKSFIDKAHQMGMAVILDMVLNHAYGQSPLVRLYWDAANNRPAANNPWFNVVSPNPVFSFGYDFNHERNATRYFVDRVNKFWIQEYKFDGFRFDFTKGFTNVPGDGGSYDQSRINILQRMNNKIREYDSTAYVILEHFAPNSEETILQNSGMMIWGNMNYQYNEATMGYASDLSGVSYKSRGWTQPNLIAYMESHDEERLMFKNLQYGASGPNGYNIKNLNVAINRIKLASAFYFPIPGPKMIWQFGELGYDISIDDPCRVCNKPILWNYFNDDRRSKLYKVISALNNLKRTYSVFSTTDFTAMLNGYGKRINLNNDSMDVTIIGNFHVQDVFVNPSFQKTGTWYEYFTGDSITVTNQSEPIPLTPGELRLYSTVKLPSPEPDLLTVVEAVNEGLVEELYLEQNYPNPFNPSTDITFSIRDRGIVSLKIYDILGREIKTLLNEEKGNGIYQVRWNGDNNSGSMVSSGIYFYRIESGSLVQTRKMILIK